MRFIENESNLDSSLSMTFLKNINEIDSYEINFSELMDNFRDSLIRIQKNLNEDIDYQKDLFNQKLKMRERNSLRKSLMNKSNYEIDLNFLKNEFLKKFFIVYFAKVLAKPIQSVLKMKRDYYNERIKITDSYNVKIKELELLKMCDESFLLINQMKIIRNILVYLYNHY